MNNTTYLILPALACLALSSCELTGDPHTGGIFWSPSKAEARQVALRTAAENLQETAAKEEAKTQSLTAQRNSLQKQIADKKAQLKNAQTSSEAAALESQISALESQLVNIAL